jgi:hypothetical protein
MLYAIAQEVGAVLRGEGVPFPVVFGPEPSASISPAARERIVIEQPIDEKRDQVLAPRAVHHNPKVTGIRMQSARIRIFARSNVAGAAWHDHAERAEQVLDHVLGALDQVVRGRKNVIVFGGGGFVALKDLEGSEVWSGAVYEQDFTVDRGIFRRTWAGEAQDEVVIGTDVTIRNQTKVSNDPDPAGTPPADAEIASGG